MRGILIATLLSLGVLPAAYGHDDHSAATYLGNEGVLVTRGDVKVVFDAFYADSYDTYLLPAPETTRALLAGTAPYDGIDAVFVSHIHGDHFSPAPTLAFLRAHPEVRFYASTQVAEALAKEAGGEAPANVTSLGIAPGDPPQTIRVGELEILAMAVPHAGGKRMSSISNIAFRVTLDGKTTVLHLGDADASDKLFAPLQESLDQRTIDAAFPPYWFFGSEEGKKILSERIRARQTIGIHVPAEAVGKGEEWRKRYDADLFTDPGESRELNP